MIPQCNRWHLQYRGETKNASKTDSANIDALSTKTDNKSKPTPVAEHVFLIPIKSHEPNPFQPIRLTWSSKFEFDCFYLERLRRLQSFMRRSRWFMHIRSHNRLWLLCIYSYFKKRCQKKSKKPISQDCKVIWGFSKLTNNAGTI